MASNKMLNRPVEPQPVKKILPPAWIEARTVAAICSARPDAANSRNFSTTSPSAWKSRLSAAAASRFATSLRCAVTGWDASVTSAPSLNWPLICKNSAERRWELALMADELMPLPAGCHAASLWAVLSAQQMVSLTAANGEVAFDNRTRQLYATDASPYQLVPAAVAFPKKTSEAAHLILAALAAGISVTPRGGGTGLSGGALGDGLIIDFARHNRAIWDLDKEARTVRVGAGVVLDQLNAFLKPFNLGFGPDVATSSRATLGGMIANDSSGAHAPVYGTTGRHVREIEIVMADGKITRIGAHLETLRRQRTVVEDLIALNSLLIAEQFPAGLLKRWPGYGLARAGEQPGNLVPILCGSEGTLAGIFSAELNLVPLPPERGLAVVFFDSVANSRPRAACCIWTCTPARRYCWWNFLTAPGTSSRNWPG